jgi:lipopolysaccharide export system permease protein
MKSWFMSFIGSFILLLILLTIANLISGFLRMNVTALEVMFNHLLELPAYLKLIAPVSCLAASLFSINKLKSTNELTAIFASGYKRSRFYLDITLCSLTVAIILLLFNFFVQPFAKAQRHKLIENSENKFKNLKSKGLMSSTIGSGRMWFKSENYMFSFSTFDKKKLQLHDIAIYYYNQSHHISDIIYSPRVSYINNTWLATNIKKYQNLDLENFPTITVGSNESVPIKQTPNDFKQLESDITTLNVFKLWKYITKLKGNGINVNEYLVLFLENFTSSFICIIFSFFSSFGALRPNRRGSSFGKNIGFVLVFVIFYWLVNSYLIELGKSSKINPFIATMTIPIIFTLYIIYTFNKNKKLI